MKIERVIVDFGQTANIVKQSVLAGSDDYDLVLNILKNQAKLSSEDCLYDLTTVPGINLSHKCWDSVGNDCMQIGGKIFCVMGDINITDNDAKINTAFGRIYDFFADQTFQLTADNSKYSSVKDLWNVLARVTFKGDRSLFFMGHIGNVRLIRDMETDFGIIPIPKLDESQDIYYSMMQSENATAYSIPVTANAERSGLILEALAEGSTDTLLPAYYETTLKRKASRDSESSDILDLIFGNRVVDYCNTYTEIGINNFIQAKLRESSNTFASSEASQRSVFTENIDKINASYKK